MKEKCTDFKLPMPKKIVWQMSLFFKNKHQIEITFLKENYFKKKKKQ
jgi:hypothetical protein